MDKFTVFAVLVVCLIFLVSLVLNVDFRVAVLHPFGIRPMLPSRPGPGIFGLDLETAGLAELSEAYAERLKEIRQESRFLRIDEARLDLAYSQALGKLMTRYVHELLQKT